MAMRVRVRVPGSFLHLPSSADGVNLHALYSLAPCRYCKSGTSLQMLDDKQPAQPHEIMMAANSYKYLSWPSPQILFLKLLQPSIDP